MTTEATAFLYPFIEAEERDPTALLVDLAASARSKISDSIQLRQDTLQRCGAQIRSAAEAMADRFAVGGHLHTFGNGGSATDADGTATAFRRPRSGRPLPATSLVEDRAIITALGNDIGFDVIFARQIVARTRPGDMVLGISTSGGSKNVLAGFAAARRGGLLTVGVCGYDGGAMAASGDIDHCIVVRSDSVHRIQEAQDAVFRALWAEVQIALAAWERESS